MRSSDSGNKPLYKNELFVVKKEDEPLKVAIGENDGQNIDEAPYLVTSKYLDKFPVPNATNAENAKNAENAEKAEKVKLEGEYGDVVTYVTDAIEKALAQINPEIDASEINEIISTYLTKNTVPNATNAKNAEKAAKAEKDNNGNTITSTYAPLSSPNFVDITTFGNSQVIKAAENAVQKPGLFDNVRVRIVKSDNDSLALACFGGGAFTGDLGSSGTFTATDIVGNNTVTAKKGFIGEKVADFAEYFEWEDKNSNNEDRRGLLVSVSNGNIKKAEHGEKVLGIISATGAFIGNAAEIEWNKKYLTDIYGTQLAEEVEIPAVIDDETGEVITPARTETRPIINPDYNPNLEYIPRSQRAEWAVVGLVGQVVTRDDGTCVPGGCVAPLADGVGTAADEGYLVLKRLDGNHVLVLVK